MKNILKGLTVSGMALLALAGGSGVVFADEATWSADATEGSASGTSTAEFKVEAGKTGKLTLDEVPDLKFKDTDVKTIATEGATLPLIDGKVTSGDNVTSKDVTAKDGNADLKLKVSDFRGVNSGWNLTAKLGTFEAKIKDSKSNDISDKLDRLNGSLNGVVLHLVVKSSPSDATKTNSVTPAVVDLKQGSADGVLKANGDKSEGGGENNFIADTSSTLTIPQDPKIKAATYQADITWTLGNTFDAAPANSNE
ncbi:WxL domain-containing protein [Enterococcus canintestini]|uniref:WxL domain-containing protein n=1 Tax=Enterococcus canintestini TaxID=317010 RepID=UPI00288C9BE4|nr:WxL domain-containing protein [Enterococcus canintestini]MDT2739834.1 WxL domain-containing protein [Enterococcus canintestini]